jgi:hypothetical protein
MAIPAGNGMGASDIPKQKVEEIVKIPWVRKFTATPNALILPSKPIDLLQEGWR